MGLEIVEIVMQIEDRFQINFSERHLAEVRTVDDLVHGIAAIFEEARNEAGTNASCPGFPAFFALRRSLIVLANVPHHSIRPSSRFTCLLSPWGPLPNAGINDEFETTHQPLDHIHQSLVSNDVHKTLDLKTPVDTNE